MAIFSSPFFELLPYRIDQAITGRGLRRLRVRYRREWATRSFAQVNKPRRLFVDMAVISRHDAGTGIQRVVRALALAMREQASAGWDVRFVAANKRRAYHLIAWPEHDETVEPEVMKARPGDVFLGLDFSLDTIRQHRRQLAGFRRDGGALWFLVCDLLPVERPEWFSPNNVIRYKAWLEILATVGDGFLCISRETEADLIRVLRERFALADGYSTSVIPMGHNILDSRPGGDRTDKSDVAVRFDTSAPFSLMVGTLEPRKGHGDIVNAFDEMWQMGAENRLVLVGRRGWKVDELQERIITHPEYGRKLMWLNDVEDLELERIYEACEGVIIASHGEGFGLPLIEALGHGKPVLARDLPVFRAHADRGVRYFPLDANSSSVAEAIRLWIDSVRAGEISVAVPNGSWQASAVTVLEALAGTRLQDGVLQR